MKRCIHSPPRQKTEQAVQYIHVPTILRESVGKGKHFPLKMLACASLDTCKYIHSITAEAKKTSTCDIHTLPAPSRRPADVFNMDSNVLCIFCGRSAPESRRRITEAAGQHSAPSFPPSLHFWMLRVYIIRRDFSAPGPLERFSVQIHYK